MGCIDKLLNQSKEIHDYLREKTGIDYDPKTGEGKQEWIKAAKDLQEHSLRTISGIYSDLKIPGFEKSKTPITDKGIDKVVNDARDNKQLGVYESLSNDEALKEIAKQAQNVQEDGSVSNLQSPEAAYKSTVNGLEGNSELVDAAIAKHPLESLISKPVVSDKVALRNESKSVEDILGISKEDADALSIIYNADLTPTEKKILYRQYKNGVMNMQDVKNYAGVIDVDKLNSEDIGKWARAALQKAESKGRKINAEDIEFEELPKSEPKQKSEVPIVSDNKSILNQEKDLKGNKKEIWMNPVGKEGGTIDKLRKQAIELGLADVEGEKDTLFKQAIDAGKMTANDAKNIIESAGIEVPKDILELANKENKKVEVQPSIENKNISDEEIKTEVPPPEPPKETVIPKEEGGSEKKGLLNRLHDAKGTPEAAKKGFEEEGLNYEPESQKEAEGIAKSVIDELGMDEAVLQAKAQTFGGDVNTLIQTESLNRLAELSAKETDPAKKLEHDKKFAEVGIGLDEWLRKQGRGISAVNYFYKKSPLGIQMIENAKRKQDFEDWAKPKDKSWKEFFDEMVKEPEFDAILKEQVKEGMKKERAESRASRIKKVDDVIDAAKAQFSKGATYVTLIPPKVITTALEGIKQAYHAGEHVVKIVQEAIDYISKELGHDTWDKEKFRKEWEDKLKDKEIKQPLTDEEVKAKILNRFRNKLKGLSDKQKEEVVRKSFQQIVESGGLDYADFKKIIADITGRGELSDAEAAKLRQLVQETNAVEDAGKKAREVRTQASIKEFREAEHKAGKAARELSVILNTKPNITKRLTSLMQLNTLGIPALINNPIYNVVNQLGLRTPIGLIKTGIDKAIYYGAKALGKEVLPETNILSLKVQREFFRKLGLGTKESVGQFLTGLNRQDYLQKEIQGQQIRPVTAMKDLWDYSKGKKNLSKSQVIDKIIQASPPGITAEIIARTLNLGDKPQRFAAEGAQASAFAKSLGLKDIDYDLFIDFPREEAYRAYKAKGLSDAEAGKKADYIKDTIVKEGQRSTFQQDNMLADKLNKVFGGEQSGVGSLAKATIISPYIKIPSNAYWSYYNIINPEVAMLQSMIYAGKAFAKTKGVKFSFDKSNSSAAKDLNEAKYWFAHAAVGMATRAVIISLVGAGVYRSENTGDDTKKEREGEQFYENQGTINVSKLAALIKGQDPNKVKNGVIVQNKWFGQWGTVGNTIARKNEDMTPEQKKNNSDFWDAAIGGMELYALQDFEQGVFGNSSSLLQAMNQGIKTGDVGYGMQAWGLNTINMFTNIIHPASSAQIERAALPYYTKQKADTFGEEVKNSMLTRSVILRKLTGKYPPAKIGIWGDVLTKKDNIPMRLFGFSHNNPDNFAQPIYEDAKRTGDIGFFPPAIPPKLNGIKLNSEQAKDLEIKVGKARKDYIAPFINNQAYIEGFDKKYKDLNDEDKKYVLEYIYKLGKDDGVDKFVIKYPQFKKPEKQENDEREEQQRAFREFIKDKN